MKLKVLTPALVLILLSFSMQAVAQKQVVVHEPTVAAASNNNAKTLKLKVAIGRFSNETEYGKGLFYDKANDPMGKQALDLLSTKLAASNKFILLERNDLAQLLEEANKNGQSSQQAIGADYMIIGSITQFGRKSTSQTKVFTSSKTQTVEAAVSLRLVDVATGQIIYSDEGHGFADITTKSTFVGTGGDAGYDATLSDKAIGAAIDQLVENIINKLKEKKWKSYLLVSDDEGTIIAGGASQGLAPGMKLSIMTKGRQVKNPQTGIMVDLPGKQVGVVEVVSTGGETPETEFSFVNIVEGSIDSANLEKYIISEL